MAEKVEAYLVNKKNSIKQSAVAESFQVLEQCYVKKLWSQLANETEKLVFDKTFVSIVDLKELYDNFIREFEHRINVLQLIRIVLPVANHLFDKNPEDAFAFLDKFKVATAKHPEAAVRLSSGEIELRLNHKDSKGHTVDLPNIRKMIEETQKQLDTIHGVTSVHASFYKVSALYLKEVGDHAEYYREALRYLGCEDLMKLSCEEQLMQATLLGFAALLGKDVYNFGELLAHPVLKTLQNSPERWLYDFLLAFNSGDLAKFYQFENKWSQWTDVVAHRDLLESKIRLLCLMEIAMSRSAKNRHITFDEISQKAQVPLDKVEFLVMKALSNGLIRGSIDQVKQIVHVNWIQPRVLSLEQIAFTADRIDQWRKDVEEVESLVAKNAKEIIVKN